MTSSSSPESRSGPRTGEAPLAELLIVDDEVFIQNAFKLYFETIGYRVWIADGRQGALAHFANPESRIDVVILDMVMPGCNGLDLLQELKIEHPTVEVIIATGCGSIATAIEAMRHGAFDYVTKPIVDFENDLLRVVEEALLRRRNRLNGYLAQKLPHSRITGDAVEQALKLFQNLTAWSRVLTQGELDTDLVTLQALLAESLHIQAGLFLRQGPGELLPVFSWGGLRCRALDPGWFSRPEAYHAIQQGEFHLFPRDDLDLSALGLVDPGESLHDLACHLPVIGEHEARGALVLLFDEDVPAFRFEGILHNGAPFQLVAALMAPFLFSLPVHQPETAS